jgi:hypothetical protein
MIEASPYTEVDAVIAKWVATVGSTLSRKWADKPARFFYMGGDAPFECFQISVGPPSEGQVSVNAHAVDTNDDTEEELTAYWVGRVADVDAMLAKAVETVESWKRRDRKRPDPPSPWRTA